MTDNLRYDTKAAQSFEFGVVSPVKRYDEFASFSLWEDFDQGTWCYVLHDDDGNHHEAVSALDKRFIFDGEGVLPC